MLELESELGIHEEEIGIELVKNESRRYFCILFQTGIMFGGVLSWS